MSDPTPDASRATETSSKSCRECAKDIPFSARKCAECDAYQDWRRIFSISNTSLSLLIALISVLAVVLPAIKSVFVGSREKVTVRVVAQRYEESVAAEALVVLLSNSGTVSAFVDPSASVRVRSSAGTKVLGVDLLSSRRHRGPDSSRGGVAISDLLLQPKTQRVFFATVPSDTPTIADPAPDSDCELTIKVLTQDGSKREEKHQYRCFDWRALGGSPSSPIR
jgi:hypothetical protein